MWSFLLGLCVAAVPVYSAVDGDSLSRSGLIQQLAERLAELAEEGRGYLGRLAGEQTVLSVHKVRVRGQEWLFWSDPVCSRCNLGVAWADDSSWSLL